MLRFTVVSSILSFSRMHADHELEIRAGLDQVDEGLQPSYLVCKGPTVNGDVEPESYLHHLERLYLIETTRVGHE